MSEEKIKEKGMFCSNNKAVHMYRAKALRTIMQQLHHHMKKRGNWKKEDVVFSIIQADRLLGRAVQ